MKRSTASVLVVFLLIASSCGSDGDSGETRAGFGRGTAGSVPTEAPSQFPLPEGVRVTDSFVGAAVVKLFLESDDPPDSVRERFRAALLAAGWVVTEESDAPGTPADITEATLISFEGFGQQGTLIVGQGATAPTGINVTFVTPEG